MLFWTFLILSDLLQSYCLGGLIVKSPSLTELFSSVHTGLGVVDNHAVDYENSGHELTETVRIEELLQSLEETAGASPELRLAQLIVDDLESIVKMGKLDIDKVWIKWITEPIQSDSTNLALDQSADSKSFEGLFRQLKEWCFGMSNRQYRLDAKKWRNQTLRTLWSILYSGKKTLKLAIIFHRFSMVWQSSHLLDSSAYAFAILEPLEWRDITIITSRLKLDLQAQPYFDSMETVLKKSFVCKEIFKLSPYKKMVEQIIKNPFLFKLQKGFLILFEKIPYQVGKVLVNDIVSLTQDLELSGPIPTLDGEFWENLIGDSEDGELHNLVDIYKDVFEFFKNGKPFDHSWEYYKLIIGVNTRTKNILQIEINKLVPECPSSVNTQYSSLGHSESISKIQNQIHKHDKSTKSLMGSQINLEFNMDLPNVNKEDCKRIINQAQIILISKMNLVSRSLKTHLETLMSG